MSGQILTTQFLQPGDLVGNRSPGSGNSLALGIRRNDVAHACQALQFLAAQIKDHSGNVAPGGLDFNINLRGCQA